MAAKAPNLFKDKSLFHRRAGVFVPFESDDDLTVPFPSPTHLLPLGRARCSLRGSAGPCGATWKEVNCACIDAGEFRLAQMCALHIIVHAAQAPCTPHLSDEEGLFRMGCKIKCPQYFAF